MKCLHNRKNSSTLLGRVLGTADQNLERTSRNSLGNAFLSYEELNTRMCECEDTYGKTQMN